MPSPIVIQGNLRQGLRKMVRDYKNQEKENKELLLGSAVETAEKEHREEFFNIYEKLSETQEREKLEKLEKSLKDNDKELGLKIMEMKRKDSENYGKRWKFYTWFGLFVLMVLTGYFLFVLYRVGELNFVKNP